MKQNACIAFQLDNPKEAYKHIETGRKVIRNYGDRCGKNNLHTWDDGFRILYQCTLCGGYILGQFSEFHGGDDDDYYSDFFPINGPEDAERVNEEYNGERIEEEFPESWLVADHGNPHWKDAYKESRHPNPFAYDPNQPLGQIQFPRFVEFKPSMEAKQFTALSDRSLSISEKLHNLTVEKLIDRCKNNGQKADLYALYAGISDARFLVLEEAENHNQGQNGPMNNEGIAHRYPCCFETENGEWYIAAFTQDDQIPEAVMHASTNVSKHDLQELIKACGAFKAPFRGIVINGFDEKQSWALSPSEVEIALTASILSGADKNAGKDICNPERLKLALIEDCSYRQQIIQSRITKAGKCPDIASIELLLLRGIERYLRTWRSVLEMPGTGSDDNEKKSAKETKIFYLDDNHDFTSKEEASIMIFQKLDGNGHLQKEIWQIPDRDLEKKETQTHPFARWVRLLKRMRGKK